MLKSDFLAKVGELYEAIIRRGRRKLRYLLVGDEDEADIYVNAAITYYAVNSEKFEWEDDRHMSHAITQKAESLRLDEIEKRRREESIEPIFDYEGNQMDDDEVISRQAKGLLDSSMVDTCDDNMMIEAAFEVMSPLRRMAWEYYYAGYKIPEIAAKMGKSNAEVYKLLERGLDDVERAFGE